MHIYKSDKTILVLIFLGNIYSGRKLCVFSSPEQRSRRAIVLPPASALALASASTNVKVLP